MGDAAGAERVVVAEDKVVEQPVCCPSGFNKLYYYLDSILDKVLWKDAASSSADRPVFTKAERYNIFFYILGIMCYKVRPSLVSNLPNLRTPRVQYQATSHHHSPFPLRSVPFRPLST
jgi:hypothetical protein